MKRENVEGDIERRWKKYYILWKKTLRRYAVSPLSTCLCLCSSCLSIYGENEWLGSAHGEAMPRPDIGIIVRRPQCSPIHSVNNTIDANHAYLNTTFIRKPCTLNFYSSHRHLSRPVSPMRYLQCLTLYFNGKSELSSRMQTMWNHKLQFISFWSIESDRQQQCCT